MVTKVRQWVRPPVFEEDEDAERAATLLNIVLWIFIIGALVYGFFAPIVPELRIRRVVIIIPFVLILLVLKQMLNRGYILPVGNLIVVSLWFMFTSAMFFGADYNNPAFMGYLVVVICAGLILSWRAALGWGLFSIVTNAVILLLGQNNILPHWQLAPQPYTFWVAQTVYILIATLLLSQALRKIDEYVAKAHHELTERKDAERKLAASESELRALFGSMHDVVLVLDRDGVYREVAPTAPDLLYWPPDQLFGKTLQDVFSPNQAETFTGVIRQVLGTQQTAQIEYQLFIRGVPLWFETRVSPMAEDRTLWVARNITERKQTEQALREAEQKYRAIFENANEGIFQVTPEGEFLTGNPAAAHILGYDSYEEFRQAVPNIVAIYVDPARRAEYRKELEIRGETHDFEAQVYRKDGERIWVSLTAHAIRDVNGNVLYFEGFAQDITERKKAELALRQSEERFKKVFQYNPVAIAITTLEKGRLLDANYAYWDLTGYHPETSIGKDAEELKMWAAPGERMEFVKDLRQKGSLFNPDDRFYHTDGSIRHVISFYELIEIGKDDCILTMFYDMTDQKQVEEKLRESESRYRAMVENQTEFIVRWKPDGTRTFVNEAYCRYFDLTHAQAISTSFLPLIVEEDRLAMESRIKRLMADIVNTETYIQRVIKPDGNIGWQEWTDQIIRDEPGNVTEFQSVGRDITERKKAEEALRESEHRLSLFFNQSLAGFFFGMLDEPVEWNDSVDKEKVLDYVFAHQHITEANEPMLAQYGATRDTFIGRTPGNFFAHDLQQGRQFRRSLFDASRLHIETEERKDDGTPIWIDGDYVCIYDSQNRLIGTFGIQRDITERKRADEELRKSEEKFRQLITSAPDAIIGANQTGKIMFASIEATKLLGYELEELMSMNIEMLMPDRFQAAHTAKYAGYITNPHPRMMAGLELFARRKDGSEVPVDINLSRLDTEAGPLVTAFIRDITVRKQAETEVQESEERYRQLAQATFEGIVIGVEGIVVDANLQGAQMFGYTLDEFVGLPILNLVPPEDQEQVYQILSSRQENFAEQPIIRKDGTMLIGEVHSIPTLYKGQPARVAAVRDITERKRMEEKLRDSNERFHQMANNIQEVFWIGDPVTNENIYVSPAYEKIWGFDHESAIKLKEFYKIVLPDDLHILQIAIEQQAKGENTNVEYRILHPNGSIHWIWERGFPILNETGKTTRVAGVATDITGRKEAEEKLRQRADQLTMLNKISNAISSLQELDSILHLIFEQVKSNIHFDVFFIALYDDKSRIVSFPILYDSGKFWEEQARDIEDTASVAHVIKTGRPYFVNRSSDEIEEARISHNRVGDSKRVAVSMIVVPLLAGNRVIGALSLQSYNFFAYGDEHHSILTALAPHVTIAIENARLFEAEQTRREEAETLRESLASIVTTFELEEVVERILDQIKFVIPYDTASVWRVDDEWQTLIVGRDLPPEIPLTDMKLKVDANISSYPLIQGERSFVLSNNVQEELPDFKGPHSYINSWLAVPLKIRDKIIGVIALDGKNKGQFTAHHAELAVTFADQVAIALENASLYTEIQQELTERKLAEESLVQFKNVMDESNDAIFLIDPESGHYFDFNKKAYEYLGYNHDELSRLRIVDIALHIQDMNVWRNRVSLVREKGSLIFEAVYRRKDTTTFPVEVSARMLYYGGRELLVAIVRDITERKHAEEELQQLNIDLEKRVQERTKQLQEEKSRLEQYAREADILNSLNDLLQASMTTEEAGQVIIRHIQQLFPDKPGALYLNGPSGLEAAMIWGNQRELDMLFPSNDCWALRRGRVYSWSPEHPGPHCQHVSKHLPQASLCLPLLAQGDTLGILHLQTNSAEATNRFLDESRLRLAETVANNVALAFANLRLRETLRRQTIIDAMTGLYNLRYMEESLTREIHRAKRHQHAISVLMFDVDNFKKFNDTFGHDGGDFVLRKFGELLQTSTRTGDIPCHPHGEEFTLILPETEIEAACQLAERLRSDTEHMTAHFNGQSLGTITVSIGVAAFPHHGDSWQAVLKVADDAMYEAKKAGKNRVAVASPNG